MAINKIIYNGGTLIDLTGDTVTADKLMQGYTAHDKTGTAIIGTATGGGTEAGTVYQDAQGYLVLDDEAGTHVNVTSLSVTENGTYTAPTGVAYSPVTVSVSGGGGGLEYEEGTWTPTENVAQPVISFSNTHSSPPMFVMMADATGTDDTTASTNYGFAYSSFYEYTGQAVPSNATTSCRYALADYVYITSTNPAQAVSGIINLTGSGTSSASYWVSETGFIPSSASTIRYWRVGRTYKWIAIWSPTT